MPSKKETANNCRHVQLSLPLLLLLLSSTLLLAPTAAAAAAVGQSPSPPFEPCVEMCIRTTDCAPDDRACMCTSSPAFLDSTVRCMFRACVGRFDSADSSFIEVVAAACRANGNPLPVQRLREARILAALLARRYDAASSAPPEAGTAPATAGSPPPLSYGVSLVTTGPAKPTPTVPALTQTWESADRQPVTTPGSGKVEDSHRGGQSVAKDTTATTSKQGPTTTPEPLPSPTLKPPPNERRPPPTEPTDSSPFAAPIWNAAGVAMPRNLVCWVIAGLAAVFSPHLFI